MVAAIVTTLFRIVLTERPTISSRAKTPHVAYNLLVAPDTAQQVRLLRATDADDAHAAIGTVQSTIRDFAFLELAMKAFPPIFTQASNTIVAIDSSKRVVHKSQANRVRSFW